MSKRSISLEYFAEFVVKVSGSIHDVKEMLKKQRAREEHRQTCSKKHEQGFPQCWEISLKAYKLKAKTAMLSLY